MDDRTALRRPIQLNLTSALELALFNGRHRHSGGGVDQHRDGSDPATFWRFEHFWTAFDRSDPLDGRADRDPDNRLGRVHQGFYPTPILSAFFEGPMEKGEDLIDGGAMIKASGVAIIGLADVADSLSAIRKLVFEDKEPSLPELLEAMSPNFEGHGMSASQQAYIPREDPEVRQ